MVIFYKKYKKYNENQLRKNKIDLINLKMKNHSPSPVFFKFSSVNSKQYNAHIKY